MTANGLNMNSGRSIDYANEAKEERDQSCFKCGSSYDTSFSCPYAEIGFQAARKARIRGEGEECDEDMKVYLPPRRHNSNGRPRKVERPT